MAGSPIRHESAVQGSAVEVQTYQPPWKTLSEFALQSDLDQPAFQQLVRLGRPQDSGWDAAIWPGEEDFPWATRWDSRRQSGGWLGGRRGAAPQPVIPSQPDLPGLTRAQERSRE